MADKGDDMIAALDDIATEISAYLPSSGRAVFDIEGLTKALKLLAAQNAPIHAAIAVLHRQYKSQPRAYQIHIWED